MNELSKKIKEVDAQFNPEKDSLLVIKENMKDTFIIGSTSNWGTLCAGAFVCMNEIDPGLAELLKIFIHQNRFKIHDILSQKAIKLGGDKN